MDNGKTIVPQREVNTDAITKRPECATISDGNLFYAIEGMTSIVDKGIYAGKAWRSANGLKNIEKDSCLIYVPEGPLKSIKGEWYGLFVFKSGRIFLLLK
ncbi:MAG: hypothetical protein KF746_08050 [Chitinophagaceae bacterium]|nr:hypothetical protein [Chitinophagaceae bacterium]